MSWVRKFSESGGRSGIASLVQRIVAASPATQPVGNYYLLRTCEHLKKELQPEFEKAFKLLTDGATESIRPENLSKLDQYVLQNNPHIDPRVFLETMAENVYIEHIYQDLRLPSYSELTFDQSRTKLLNALTDMFGDRKTAKKQLAIFEKHIENIDIKAPAIRYLDYLCNEWLEINRDRIKPMVEGQALGVEAQEATYTFVKTLVAQNIRGTQLSDQPLRELYHAARTVLDGVSVHFRQKVEESVNRMFGTVTKSVGATR